MAGDAIEEQSDIPLYHKSDTCPSVSWLVTPLKSKVTFSFITRVRHVSQCLIAGDAIEERHVPQCLVSGDAIKEQSDIRLYHKIQTRVPVSHGW